MRRVVALTALLVCVVVGALMLAKGADDAPTEASVLQALRDGGSRFGDWGDAALPHVKRIAASGRASELDLLRALRRIGTAKAATVFVDWLEGKPGVKPMFGIMWLGPIPAEDPFLERLAANPRFKPAIVSQAKTLFRRSFVETSAKLGWVDMTPRIRAMLNDNELDVREAAAEALRQLTGESVVVKRPKREFPKEALVEGLLGEPVALPRRGDLNPEVFAFTRWFDGEPRFVFGWSDDYGTAQRELRIATDDPADFRTFPLAANVHQVQVLTAPGRSAEVFANAEHPDETLIARKLICVAPDGTVRWAYKASESGLAAFAPLYDDNGLFGLGLACGGEDGIVGVGFDGKQIWQSPRHYTVYGITTHREAPGYAFLVTGGSTMFSYTRDSVTALFSGGAYTFLTHAAMVPNPEGGARVIGAGKRHEGDEPVIQCFDHKASILWTATLPSHVSGLVLVEPPGRARLLIATTDLGAIYALDDQGTLLWHGRLPAAPDVRAPIAVYTLAAGQHAAGKWALAVELLHDAYLIPIDAERLPARAAKR